MLTSGPARPPFRLVLWIVTIAVVPLAGLGWLGWRLFEQDRQLAKRQARDRIEHGADVLVAALQRSVAASEQRLASGSDDWPDGALALTFERGAVTPSARDRLAYLPAAAPQREVPRHLFEAAEELEFRRRDLDAAIAAYRGLVRAPDPAVRAGALLRLARTLERSGRTEEALEAYERLSRIEGVSELGFDLVLAAIQERCRLFDRHGRAADLLVETRRLDRELTASRSVTGSQYFLFAADMARWTGPISELRRVREAFAEAAGILWDEWNAGGARRPVPARRMLAVNGGTIAVLSQPTSTGARALLATPAFVRSEWLAPVARAAADQKLTIVLRDPEGTLLGESSSAAARPDEPLAAFRSSAHAELPWTVVVTGAGAGEVDSFAWRWQLLASGFLLLVGMATAASCLVLRAVGRELAVARLQSEFVAAVSHEFRTPLTTLRQFTDMLREQPRLDEARRALCYDAQARATDRLTRLVESVLDFGRLEAGARPFRLEPRNCTDLVRAVVDDFRSHPHAAGSIVEFSGAAGAPVKADDEALPRAVWNLLDNAVKYSPGGAHVQVSVTVTAAAVAVAVRDHGLGIPADERSAIFAKFQRGEQARRRGIRGTGIGLAMVQEIVRAHGGRIDVVSQPGAGSTFTIVLPVAVADISPEVQDAACGMHPVR